MGQLSSDEKDGDKDDIPWDPSPPERVLKADRARLVPVSTRWPGDELVLKTSPIRVGRDKRAELRLPYGGLSRHHADIRYNAKTKTWFVLDLSSRNGTFVNRKKVVSHSLDHGDTLHFHSEAFLFERVETRQPSKRKTSASSRRRKSSSGRSAKA